MLDDDAKRNRNKYNKFIATGPLRTSDTAGLIEAPLTIKQGSATRGPHAARRVFLWPGRPL